ncbi:YbaY family lipoprotein [Shewanella surugensis]|uniref:YbaY family lipoprotein n=1 Tax=Shewanella surugensis TaxID=212020 RepID=A0ABT0LDG9_9GAMM|nr:YbaY family lipoprotein [Shewanella surugensis]MCL1125729.1 YbaY family lipoprotein [Shewanella surugensis]
MMLSLKSVFVFIVAPLLLMACSTSDDEYIEIDGLVSYRTPVTLPDTAILTVKLKDITDHSQPAIIIDELNREKVTLPARFSFRVPRDELVEGHMDIIRAYVKYKDKLIFMNINAAKVRLDSSEPMLIMLEKVSE